MPVAPYVNPKTIRPRRGRKINEQAPLRPPVKKGVGGKGPIYKTTKR